MSILDIPVYQIETLNVHGVRGGQVYGSGEAKNEVVGRKLVEIISPAVLQLAAHSDSSTRHLLGILEGDPGQLGVGIPYV